MPFDPELDAKITEVDNFLENQIDDKLQAMLVSVGVCPWLQARLRCVLTVLVRVWGVS